MNLDFGAALGRVRRCAPLVHCITNFVTVNDCANIILAAGGSPTMGQDAREVEEIIRGAQALVCNLGAIEQTESMILAGREANRLGRPAVLDPVAVGGTRLRRETGRRLLEAVRFSVIRGNASEIRHLAGEGTGGSGVDVSALDAVTEENLPEAVRMVSLLARETGGVVAVSGPLDVISDGARSAVLRNGCATMARITGSGCMVTSLIGAFCGALPEAPFEAACAAMAAMGVAGEWAERRRLEKGAGNATFRNELIDGIFCLTEQQLREGANYEIYEG